MKNIISVAIIFILGTALLTQYSILNLFFGYAQTEQSSNGKLNTFYDDFIWGTQPYPWYNVSGAWEYTPDGLHGGSNKSLNNNTDNILISPGSATSNFKISTSFKVNDAFKDGQTAHYASVIYSFIDPENYKFAGINIYLDDIYVVFAEVINGTEYHSPSWLGNATGLIYQPGTLFNIVLFGNGSNVDLILNGTGYTHDEREPLKNGFYGLYTNKITDINFNSFESQATIPPVENTSVNQIIDNKNVNNTMNSNEVISDSGKQYIVKSSETILLSEKELPAGSYIHLYNSSPYKIVNGNIAAKLPCNEANSSDVNVLIGQIPNLQTATLQFVEPLSTPGDLCLYDLEITSDETNIITDIAIRNNSTDDIDFSSTSSIIINVSEISEI